MPEPLDYEPADRFALHKRERLVRRLFILGVIVFAALLIWGNAGEIQGRWDQWKRDRAFERALEKPAGERFPPGQVVYAVPKDFYSDSVPVRDPALFGTISPESLAASAELAAATSWRGDGPAPILFLGKLIDAEGTEVLFGVVFLRTYVWDQDTTWLTGETTKAGFYTDLQYLYDTRKRGSGGTGEHRHLGSLSLLDWDYKWQDSQVAALPLTFYGSYVDPEDASVAVIPFRLGENAGRLRISIRHSFENPESSVEWD